MSNNSGRYYIVDKTTEEVIDETSYNPLGPVVRTSTSNHNIYSTRHMITTIVVAFLLCVSFFLFLLIFLRSQTNNEHSKNNESMDFENYQDSSSSFMSDSPSTNHLLVYNEIDEMTSLQIFQYLKDAVGPAMIAGYLDEYSNLRILYPAEEISNLYVYAFSEGNKSGKENRWNEEIEEYIDGYLFSETDADYYSSFSPY